MESVSNPNRYVRRRPGIRSDNPASKRRFRVTAMVVPACFFISGMAGLVYQTLWVRMIDKVIGSAPFAVAAVVSVFMGGLALGSYIAGRFVDRMPDRNSMLALYGKIEIGVGLYALAFPWLIAAVKPVYVLAYAHLWDHPWLYTFFTFCGCLLLLLPPTTLMGATLPVLCRYYVVRLDTLGTRAGGLYSLNTVGAGVGAVLCGFFLIPKLGLTSTLHTAVGVNLAIGVCCLLLSGRRLGQNEKLRDLRTEGQGNECCAVCSSSPANNEDRWALAVFFISGFCAMACEVYWTRLIGLIIGPTTYAFSLVVAAFIVGLAAGGMLFGWLGDKLDRDLGLLHVTQFCAALLSLGVSQFLGDSQFFFAKVIHANRHDYSHLLLWQSLLLFGILLGPTLCWGAAFPLVNRIRARCLPSLGKSIGNACAVNTVGAILGAFCAGYIVIPLAGKETGLQLTVALQLATACLGLAKQGWTSGWSLRARIAVMCLLLIGPLVLTHYPSWEPGLLSRGWYRDFDTLRDDLERTGWMDALLKGKTILAKKRTGQQVVFQSEGVGGFTTVEKEITSMGAEELALFNSGKADASSHGDRSTQTLSGHIPLLFHPNPKKVMVLGLASGMTAGEALLYPIERLDILEINEQVVQACGKFFTPYNRDCLNDPRTRLVVQDGRNHLALNRQRYDVIVSEPSNPWMAGLANLYTRDFFRLVKDRLTDQGVFAQWIQAYEMDWETFSLLGRTFTSVFGGGALIEVGPGDYLLMGFADKRGLVWETARDNIGFARRSDRMILKDISCLARLVVTEDLPRLFGTGPLHTDDRPRLEFAAPRRLYGGGLDMNTAADRRRLSATTLRLIQEHTDNDSLLDLAETGVSLYLPLFSRLDPKTFTTAQHKRYLDLVRSYCDCTLAPSYRVFGDPEAKQICARMQARRIENHLDISPGRSADHYNLGLALSAAGRIGDAVKAFETAASMAPDNVEAYMALGLLAAQDERFSDAVRYLRPATELSPTHAEAHKNLGMAQAGAGDLDAAAKALSFALRLSPDDVTALNELGLVYLRMGRIQQAEASLSHALRMDYQNPEAHHNLGLLFFAQGNPEQAVAHFENALRLCPSNANVLHNLQSAMAMLQRQNRGEQ